MLILPENPTALGLYLSSLASHRGSFCHPFDSNPQTFVPLVIQKKRKEKKKITIVFLTQEFSYPPWSLL